ncbi:hypothetical protein BDQ17DRAFT_1550409 [Cyathus striatus]|nr:hypothetical protein BDQ17DRAFT_1550409 [Cyathus striatus]
MESCTVRVSYSDQPSVQQLPDELLAEIFAYICEPTDDDGLMGSSPNPIWGLQKVCMRWRRLVRSIPSLWSVVNVVTRGASDDIISQRIQTCLKLSGTTPLSISLSDFGGSPVLLHQIMSQADRWGSLTITKWSMNGILSKPELMDLVKQRGLAQLRKLTIDEYSDSTVLGEERERQVFEFFSSATALEEVNFFGLFATSDTSKFPWAGVKKLQMMDCHLDGDDNISIFGALSSLEELALGHNFIILDSIPQDLVVPLPALHSLRVEEHPDLGQADFDDSIPQYWRLYHTPSLTNIHIINDIWQCFEYFSSMIRTASSVKTLRLESCSATFFRQIVEQLPDVEELSLINMGDLNGAISQLIWDPENNETGTNLLPFLQKLVINHDPMHAVTEDDGFALSLIDVIRSRTTVTAKKGEEQLSTPTASPLRFVKCYFVDPEEHCASSLAQLNSYGGESEIQVKVEIGKRDLGRVWLCRFR